jgi:peptidyl-prolyl cis-trans isomerase C
MNQIFRAVRILSCMTLFLAFSGNISLADNAAPKNDKAYVATVNGKGITRKEFDNALREAQKQFSRIGVKEGEKADKKLPDMKKEVMNRLIDLELLYQDSTGRAIVVEDYVLKKDMKEFKQRFKSREEFEKYLKEYNLTEDELLEQFRRRRTVQDLRNILRQEMAAKVKVSDADARAFYDRNIDKFQHPAQIRVSHILVAVSQNADEAEKKKAREKIEGIQKELKNGADFADLARKESQCESRNQGGDLGFFPRGRMVKPFDDAAFKLKPGEMSGIVETRYGYHIIKMQEKRPAGPVPFDEVKDKIKRYLAQVQIEQMYADYLKQLRKKADIHILIDVS